MIKINSLLLIYVVIVSISCSDNESERENIVACEGYPCYEAGVCHEVVGRKYDLKNGCYEGLQEIKCLDKVEFKGLSDTTYYLMGTGDNKNDCWLFGNWLPKGGDWSTEVTPLCYNVTIYVKEECTK